MMCRRQLAMAVEDSERVFILECGCGAGRAGPSEDWHLSWQQDMRPLQAALPTSLQFDTRSRLWVAGGLEGSAALPEIAILTQVTVWVGMQPCFHLFHLM